MPARAKATEVSWLSRLMVGIYRYLPLPGYALLLAACYVLPFVRKRLAERLCMIPPRAGRSPVVWFHASSVGEISTIAPVVAEVRRQRPDCSVIVSTMTVSGCRRAREILKSSVVFLLPLDFYPCMGRLVSSLKPSAVIIGETEIWPNLVLEAHSQGAHIILLNGRISRKSFPRYRLIRPLMRYVLSRFDLLLMRTETDAHRMRRLGAPGHAVDVAGNTKYDILPGPSGVADRERTRRTLGIDPSRRVITLGSAREGECETIFRAMSTVMIEPSPVMIVAPRHLGLVSQVEQICRSLGLRYQTVRDGETGQQRIDRSIQVIIIAQMGRLLELYAISDIAIVGGTFKPFGGHNPLEPASQGVVTIVGPHVQNIEDDIEYLESQGCAFIAREEDLARLLEEILSDRQRRDEMGRGAAAAVEAKKGIARKCVEIMVERNLLP